MKIFNYSLIIYLFFFLNSSSSFQSGSDVGDVGTGGRENSSYLDGKNSNFKKGKDFLKKALKSDKKGKPEKANKNFEKSIQYFILANKEFPNNIEILNHLGFVYNMLEDLIMSEIYYKEGLQLDPKNILLNQKLGELYINTKRIDLAKERLKVLSYCNCREYFDLKNFLEKN